MKSVKFHYGSVSIVKLRCQDLKIIIFTNRTLGQIFSGIHVLTSTQIAHRQRFSKLLQKNN